MSTLPTHDDVAAHVHRYAQLHLDANPAIQCWQQADQGLDDLHARLAKYEELAFGWKLLPESKAIDTLQNLVLADPATLAAMREHLKATRAYLDQERRNMTEFAVQSILVFLARRPAGMEMLAPGAPSVPVDVRNPTLGRDTAYLADDADFRALLSFNTL
jgi:hypothetical protein